MSLTPKHLRDYRRWLRTAEDNLLDVADCIGDAEQRRRLRAIAKEVEGEIVELDRKISRAETNGGAR